jgi:hypothetical protein
MIDSTDFDQCYPVLSLCSWQQHWFSAGVSGGAAETLIATRQPVDAGMRSEVLRGLLLDAV